MPKLCIIRGFPSKTDKKGSFINAHEEFLNGEKVVLDNYYPNYTFKGRVIRYFYSRSFIKMKALRLLPFFIYHKLVIMKEFSEEAVHDSIAGFFKTHDVNIVLAEFGNVGAAIAKHTKKLGVPLIVHFHGHDAHREPMLAELRDSYKVMFDAAFKVLSVSKYMTKSLIDLGADPNKIIYNPYGPRDSFFEVSPTYENTILSVGRFCDIKANYLVIMAFRDLLGTNPNVNLVMVGHGELLETCKGLAKTWGIGDRVTFLGGVNHEEIRGHFERACCFVQHSVVPSYGDAEGTPVAVLEAGASGLPVVATKHAGIADVVVHGDTGFLVGERDVKGMANYLRVLLEDKDLCRKMGNAAREHIRKNFNIDRHIACLQDVVDTAKNQISV